jgi:dienelactone hydrolase
VNDATLRHGETSDGIRFGLLDSGQARRAPALLNLSGTLEDSLTNPDFYRVTKVLAPRGVVCVSIDLPCHGRERREGEPENGLAGWRQRLELDESVVADLVSRASAVLDSLVESERVDPLRIAACGTSRGGFAALHFAAADPRVGCVAAFAPVTDLLALAEFSGLEENVLVRSLDLVNAADVLRDRRVWVCIGNNDERVGTDRAIAFARGVWRAAAACGRPAHVELHVMAVEGHRVHATAHDEAAAWIAKWMAVRGRSASEGL